MIKLKNLLTELEFKTPEDFAAYKEKHKLRKGTVVKVAGKDKVIGDEPKPKVPKKTTGTDTKKPASKDDIEKNIMGDKPKLDPKVEKRAKDNYNDAIDNIKNPQMAGGIEPYYVDMAADNLEKLGNPDAKVFKDLGKQFRDNLDDDGNPKNEKLDKQIQDKIKLAALDLETDITKDVGTEIKDGKIKSSGPQQFTDDVKNIKGEYDLGGGVKIKDGKMFDADGEEMDDDDIDDFYYQDAYDEKGVNVGIDIKKISEVYLKKSLDLLNEAQVWERKFGEPLPTFSSVMEKHSGKKIDEQGALSKRAGINVFGDRKLQLMAKGLRQSAFDLEKVAKRKDEQAFDDILQRITITIGVIRSFLNKPKRSM